MDTAKTKAESDKEMLRKLKANKNDKDALLAIFDCYATDVYALALTKISARMPALVAEDAAQQILICVFASLLVNLDSIEPNIPLSDYLMASTGRAVDQYVEAQEARISGL